MLSRLIACAAFAAGIGVADPGAMWSAAHAGSDIPTAGEVAEISLLPGWQTERGTHIAALRVVLMPGWKTYWRAPGDAGIPPSFDWSGSRNIASVRLHWPTPRIIRQNGMTTVGYKGELILPIELTPAGDGPIFVRALLELGVCRDVCMPMSVELRAELNGGQPDPRIRAAMDDMPVSPEAAGVASVACRVEPIADGVRMTADVTMPRMGPDELAVFELPDRTIWISEASMQRRGQTLTAMAELVPPSGAPFPVDRSSVRITVLGAGSGVDIHGCNG